MTTSELRSPRVLAPAGARRRQATWLSPAARVLVHVILVGSAVYFLIPLLWLLFASTKDNGDLFSAPALWFGHRMSLFSNLSALFRRQEHAFPQWMLNTLLYAGGGAGFGTLLALMTGYALAMYSFRGRETVFGIILGAILVPSTALVIPLYLLFSSIHLTDTYWAVFLPGCLSPLGVYISRIYAAGSIPISLIEAARIDGASEFRTFLQIAVPIMRPALISVFLFQFVANWNNLFLPQIMLSNDRLFPVTLGLQTWNLSPQSSEPLYNLIITGSLISILPLLVLFIGLQRYWVKGLATGSVVG